jgi:hypothetical protein
LVLAVGALGLFVVNKVPEIAQNPAGLGRLIAEANPNMEMIDADEEKRTIRVRNKESGETLTIRLDDLKAGRIKFEREGKEGTDTLEVGGKVRLPNWVPKFPGVEPVSVGSASSATEGEGGIVTFETSASEEKIVAFYRDGLEKRGLTVKATGPALVMQNEEDGLHATVTISDDSGGKRRVTVAYGEKRQP